jgi:inner membrane protein
VDPVTHSAFAVCCATAFARLPDRFRPAALAGLAGGLWPDADIFLKSAEDPLFQIEYHRHFTHSVAFSPVMMLLAAGSAWLILRLFRQRIPMRTLLLPGLVAIWSHIFCDWWTSYGTRILWPFSDVRLGLDWISVVDPLMTVPLILAAVFAVVRRARRAALCGLIWAGFYLALCVHQKSRVEAALHDHLASAGIQAVRTNVKPSFGNIVVWRATWLAGGVYHAAAIRPGLPGDIRFKAGDSEPFLMPPIGDGSVEWQGLPGDSTLVEDVRRFYRFSDGWVAWFPGKEGTVLGDMRYARLPNEFQPLWGITLARESPQAHAGWATFRQLNRDEFRPLWEMICGRGF